MQQHVRPPDRLLMAPLTAYRRRARPAMMYIDFKGVPGPIAYAFEPGGLALDSGVPLGPRNRLQVYCNCIYTAQFNICDVMVIHPG